MRMMGTVGMLLPAMFFAMLLAGGCTNQVSRPTTMSSAGPVESDHWHVVVTPPGGFNNVNPGAILWNSSTGETWRWDGGNPGWSPMSR